MTINIGYDTYKFWNCADNVIEVSTDTLNKLGLSISYKYSFKDYNTVLNLISKKHNIPADKLYSNKNNYRYRCDGFNG